MIFVTIYCQRHKDKHTEVLDTTEAIVVEGKGDGKDDIIIKIDDKEYWFNKADLLKAIKTFS